jgi:hypothetical protein
MKTNVGVFDRAVRIILGAGLVSLVFVGPQTPWGYLGLVPIATGLIGFCPLYAMLGINTAGVRKVS